MGGLLFNKCVTLVLEKENIFSLFASTTSTCLCTYLTCASISYYQKQQDPQNNNKINFFEQASFKDHNGSFLFNSYFRVRYLSELCKPESSDEKCNIFHTVFWRDSFNLYLESFKRIDSGMMKEDKATEFITFIICVFLELRGRATLMQFE